MKGKVLNLYAGIGGNRKLWKDCNVTAVEYNPEIAAVYAELYPEDNLIVGDAHQYLLDNYDRFNFIWSSPPCQTHSSFRQNICVRYRGTKAVYPDMSLYQEILFLRYNIDSSIPGCPSWVVENVKPYYEPLVEPDFKLQRHYFWCNFEIDAIEFEKTKIRSAQIPDLQRLHGIDLTGKKIKNKRQVLRNCVLPELGEHIFKESHNK